MNNEQELFWSRVISGLRSDSDVLLRAAMWHVATDLSNMIGSIVNVGAVQLEAVPLSQVVTHAGDPEKEIVGIYLNIQGDLEGQALMMLSLTDAFHLVDLLLEEPAGTTTELGDMERSALAEVGNVGVSSFLNALATLTRTPLRPSTPAVMVDMLGAILDVIAAPVAMARDDVIIIRTEFVDAETAITARFWVLPDDNKAKRET